MIPQATPASVITRERYHVRGLARKHRSRGFDDVKQNREGYAAQQSVPGSGVLRGAPGLEQRQSRIRQQRQWQ